MADEERGRLKELLAEMIGARPTRADFTDENGTFDPLTYAAAMQTWTDGFSVVDKAAKAQDNFTNGLFEMPDGTLVPLEDLDETEIDLVNRYNTQLYNQALSKFGLDEFASRRADVGAENDRRSQQFRDKIEEVRMSLGYDEAEQARAAQELDRWLAGQDVAAEDASNIAQARESARAYGTTNGKRSFSGNDLGGAVAALARQGGLDAGAPLITYPGTQTLDPVGDRLASLEAMGISNAPPAVPQLGTSRSMLPVAPELMQLPSGGGAGMPPSAPPMLTLPPESQGLGPPGNNEIEMPQDNLDTQTTGANLPPWRPRLGW